MSLASFGHLAAGTPIAAITPPNSYLHHLVESEGCGRWFANGSSDELAAWILSLKDDPLARSRYGNSARALLEATATPTLVTSQYRQLLARHLPKGKSSTLDLPDFNNA